MNKIAAGYRFTFNSCDIRQENPFSVIKEGLSESEANFFFDLSEAIQGGTALDIRSSNAEWRIKKEHEKLYSIFEKHSNLFTDENLKAMKDDVGRIMDYISENMIGYSYSDHVDMRTLVNYKIEYVPEDIIINDVTEKFLNKI
jgi:hypothetical protein